jgi:LuxR family transcriptional regulator, maltose regulon positive regulatory protein
MTGGGLLPRLAPTLVERPRLFTLLDRGTQGPVTLVAAPAGSGKTMLLSSWLRISPPEGASAWVSVQREETDATHFWGMVMDALRGSGAIAAGDPLATLVPAPTGSQAEFLQRLLEGLGRLEGPLLLVLDDLHHLRSDDALATLEHLLAHAPPQLRTLIASRRDPKLGLHRLRLAGDLLEIRAADLDFTAEEAGELLTAAGVAVDDGDLARLHERTEGWAAGLRLAALSLARHEAPDRFVAEFSGSERTVADYLLGEVLASQPPEVRDLLLRTSILERVNGPLADLLTGRSDGARLLHELEEANALVVATDVARSWFRCHHLLGDLLRLELRREAPGDIPRLHRLTAAWHAEHGNPLEAIRHAQLGEDWELATELLGRHWVHLLLDGEEVTLASLLAGLPDELTERDAELATIAAADRLAAGRWPEADALLAAAEASIDALPPARRRRAETALATAQIVRARRVGDANTVVDAASGMLHLDGAADAELSALGLMNLGIAETWMLRLQDAEAHLRRALALGRTVGRPFVEVGCIGTLGIVANLSGRLDDAKDLLGQAVAVVDRVGWSQHPIVGAVYVTLAGVHIERGQFTEAQRWLDRAEPILADAPEPAASVGLRHSQGLVAIVHGRPADALAAFREGERLTDQLRAPHFLAVVERQWQLRMRLALGDAEGVRAELEDQGAMWLNLRARVLLAEDDAHGAAAAVAPVVAGEAFVYHVNFEIEALLLDALARRRMGEREAAERSIERALAIAEPQGRVVMFLTIPGVRELLGAHPLHRSAHAAHLKLLLDHLSGSEPAEAPQELPEPLSERELSVLRFLPTNLSASEIGGELYLSVHTVKTHMRKLYAKLDVHTRAEAVQRGRALGLLAPARRGE